MLIEIKFFSKCDLELIGYQSDLLKLRLLVWHKCSSLRLASEFAILLLEGSLRLGKLFFRIAIVVGSVVGPWLTSVPILSRIVLVLVVVGLLVTAVIVVILLLHCKFKLYSLGVSSFKYLI
jgi:hypothetical protein